MLAKCLHNTNIILPVPHSTGNRLPLDLRDPCITRLSYLSDKGSMEHSVQVSVRRLGYRGLSEMGDMVHVKCKMNN